MLEGERKIISGALGDSAKNDIASLFNEKGKDAGDAKSFFNGINSSLKRSETGQNENYIKSELINEKAFESPGSDQLISTTNQGNLKLNLTELLKLAENKINYNINGKFSEGPSQTGFTYKSDSSEKESVSFNLKQTIDPSGVTILKDREIKYIGKIEQPGTANYLPEPIPRIIDHLLYMIRTGEYKGRLHITPPELGKLDIDLTYKNGHIQANLSAENSVVKEIIEANLNQLKNQLNSQGFTVDRFDVMVSLNNGESREGNTNANDKNSKGSFAGNGGSVSDMSMENAASHKITNDFISDSKVDVHV
jgi:hypothetical protein